MEKEIDKVKEALKEAGGSLDSDMIDPDVFIEQAKSIAGIAFDSFNEELLDRALDIAKAVAKFAHQLESKG